MISLSIIAGATILADAYMQVNGYQPWFWDWKKKEPEEKFLTEEESKK